MGWALSAEKGVDLVRYTKFQAVQRSSRVVFWVFLALVWILTACSASTGVDTGSRALTSPSPTTSAPTPIITFTPEPAEVEAIVVIQSTPDAPPPEPPALSPVPTLTTTVPLTQTDCFVPPPVVFLEPSSTSLTAGQVLTMTFWSSPTFASGARASLLADGATLAYLDRTLPSEPFFVSEEQFLLRAFPEQIYLASAGYGEFVLEAVNPGVVDLEVVIFGDTFFCAFVEQRCGCSTTHLSIFSPKVGITIRPYN